MDPSNLPSQPIPMETDPPIIKEESLSAPVIGGYQVVLNNTNVTNNPPLQVALNNANPGTNTMASNSLNLNPITSSSLHAQSSTLHTQSSSYQTQSPIAPTQSPLVRVQSPMAPNPHQTAPSSSPSLQAQTASIHSSSSTPLTSSTPTASTQSTFQSSDPPSSFQSSTSSSSSHPSSVSQSKSAAPEHLNQEMKVMGLLYTFALSDFRVEAEILTKPRLQELVREIDPTEQLDEEVEELMLQFADDFFESAVNSACLLAKHRHASTVEVKDVQLHLERNWNMWIPGFGTDELRPYKRAPVTDAHRQRMALIRKTIKKY